MPFFRAFLELFGLMLVGSVFCKGAASAADPISCGGVLFFKAAARFGMEGCALKEGDASLGTLLR